MGHFYGGIQGQAGGATRMGSKNSGYSAYAQTHSARVSIELRHVPNPEGTRVMPNVTTTGKNVGKPCDGTGDIAHISLSGGHSTYYSDKTLASINPNNVIAALNTGDEKMRRIFDRIRADFDRLDAEAPKALKRAERKRREDEKERDRIYREKQDRLAALAETITDTEREHFCAALGYTEDERADMNLVERENINSRVVSNDPEPERNEDGDLMIVLWSGSWRIETETWNLTTGYKIVDEVYGEEQA